MSAPGPKKAALRNENQQALENLSKVLEAKAAPTLGAGTPAKMAFTASMDSESTAAALRVKQFIDTD